MASASVHIGSVSARVAAAVAAASDAARSENRRLSVAISGGSLPKLLAAGLPPDAPVDHWDVFLADERIVPLDHPDSNYREVTSRMPRVAVVPIDPSLPPRDCAAHYEQALVERLGRSPVFDLLLLGLGPDGHTCSLFPAHPLLKETGCLVAPITDSPKPPPQRVTLTLPVLNAAKRAMFVCTGAGKAPVVKDILENDHSVLPGALVRPTDGSLDWFLDEAAASSLTR